MGDRDWLVGLHFVLDTCKFFYTTTFPDGPEVGGSVAEKVGVGDDRFDFFFSK